MHIGIATDIYGKQEGLDQLAFSLRSQGAEVSLISPYEMAFPGSDDEQEVYAAFVEQCGHDHYSKKIFEVLHKEDCNVAIGFSAGASAMWRALAGGSSLKSLHHFLGFYPTRIRKYLDYFPQTPTTLVFPYFEEVVNVEELIKEITVRGNICCLKAPYLHGFLNPLSENYSVVGERDFAGVLSMPKILCDPGWCRKELTAVCGE